MAEIGHFAKQPAESYSIDVDYTGRLPTGTLVLSGTVGAVDTADDSDVSGTVLASTSATIINAGLGAQVGVLAGTSGKRYKITFTATLDSGDMLEDDITMTVHDI